MNVARAHVDDEREAARRPCRVPSSATLGMSAGGRLSITKNPRSSSTSAAAERPAPDMPVMIVTSSVCRVIVVVRPSAAARRGSCA